MSWSTINNFIIYFNKYKNVNRLIMSKNTQIHNSHLTLDDFDFNDTLGQNQNDSAKSEIIDTEDSNIRYFLHIILPKITKENKLKEFYYAIIKFGSNPGGTQLFSALKYVGLSGTEVSIAIEYLKKYQLLFREYVDLDLPSKTLWCTENLEPMDLTFTLNNTEYSAEDGSYYTWSNIEPNANASDSNGNFYKLKDQYRKQVHDFSKNKIALELKDDAAYNVDKHYRIPTYQNFIELFENTDIIELKLDEYTQNLGYVLVSKMNVLKFIHFPYNPIKNFSTYLTSELIREKSGNSNDPSLIVVKLMQQGGTLELRHSGYQLWQSALVPTIPTRIRPIYIE